MAAVGTANLPWIDWDYPVNQMVTNSYGYNGYLYTLVTPYLALPPSRLSNMFPKPSAIQRPAQTPLFFDEICLDAFPFETDSAASDLYIGQPSAFAAEGERNMACCTILRHGGRTATSKVSYNSGPLPGAINMSFGDGHGELVKLQSLWNCYWHLNWNPALAKAP